MFRFCFNHLLESTEPLTFYGQPVPYIGIAETQMGIVADYTLHLHDKKLMSDYSNFGWIEKLVDSDWVEVDEDELDDLTKE